MSSDDIKQENVTPVMTIVQEHFTGGMLAAGEKCRTASTRSWRASNEWELMLPHRLEFDSTAEKGEQATEL